MIVTCLSCKLATRSRIARQNKWKLYILWTIYLLFMSPVLLCYENLAVVICNFQALCSIAPVLFPFSSHLTAGIILITESEFLIKITRTFWSMVYWRNLLIFFFVFFPQFSPDYGSSFSTHCGHENQSPKQKFFISDSIFFKAALLHQNAELFLSF